MSKNQQKLVSFLKNSESYAHKVSRIKVYETHISWIFLTGKFAYKVKKEIKFGNILDFSTLRLRKKFCQIELNLNKILCNDMYIDVVKMIRENGIIKLVNLDHLGRSLEYAVKMTEFPQKYRMDNLLVNNKINRGVIDKLVKVLVNFHGSTPTSSKIKQFGKAQIMRQKVDENFITLSKLTKVNPLLEKKLVSFIQNNEQLFDRRIEQNKIRDIHGDFHLQNIFFIKGRFYPYDRIEFNDILRYADVAEDVAHLAMDLDFYMREDLRRHFISKYIAESNDQYLYSLIHFLMCYKACMRGKVMQFKASNEINEKRRLSYEKESGKLFTLAESYLILF